MSVMLSLLSWFLLVMAAGGGLHTNSATAEVTIASNSAAVAAYWHTMLPNTIMPSAILELLAPPAYPKIFSTTTNDVQKSNGLSNPSTTNGVQSPGFRNWGWGSSTKNDNQKTHGRWVSTTTDDVKKSNGLSGPSPTNGVQSPGFRNWGWGSSTKNDVQKTHGRWVSTTTDDVQKSNGVLGPSTTNGVQSPGFRNWGWGSSTKNDVQKNKGESHIGQDNHKHGTMPNRVFIEESLKPGSIIPCYVLPSYTSGAPLLTRDIADTIPMSTRNFTDIMRMFAPLSNNMDTDIWLTMDYCEHPQATKGETKACATSVESMVEFAAYVLGVSTYNLRAFSSPDVPAEGVMTGRRYKVAAATRVTHVRDTITCHGMRFPFAMFMCHAVNPTRVYSVTLEGDDVGADGAGHRMEVLAVCHLDTSDFDLAKMPVHVKPGDAPLCHFVSRDSIVWAPAAPSSGHAAA